MTWYAASVIMGMRPKEGGQYPMRVYENVFLLEGDEASVLDEAKKLGMAEASANDDFRLDDKPAEMFFAGVRKLIKVSNPDPLDLDGDRPVSGTEITYSEFEVSDDNDLKSLVDGRDVKILYVD